MTAEQEILTEETAKVSKVAAMFAVEKPDIAARFGKLQESAKTLRQYDAQQRCELLKGLWAATQKRQKAIFEAAYKERRSHDLDVAAELMMIKGEIDHMIKHLPRWMKPKKVKGSMATLGKKCFVQYEPKGVVLNLSAWNAPTAISLIPLIAAIAAGNAVALKPSELAPHSAQIVEDILREALPIGADCFQGGPEIAQALLAQPFNHIYYTGGYAVGSIVMKAAAEYFAGVTLEMGGKSPVIIDESAKLENAATKLAWGRNMNAGQVCIAPDYVIAHENIRDEFVTLLSDKISELYDSEGSGFDKSRYMPRIINARHHARIKGLIDDALEKGATLASGGGSDEKDLFIEPTLLTNVTEDMRVMQEEVFGPVMAITSFTRREEVPNIIARRPKPLALYIYSTNKNNIDYFMQNTTAGSTVINNNCIQSGTNPNLPFGGIGHSGMGRIGGFRGFEEMSNARSVVYQPLDRFRDFLMQLPPYSERYEKIIMGAIRK